MASLTERIHKLAQSDPFAVAAIDDRRVIHYATLSGYVRAAAERLRRAGPEAGGIAGFRFRDPLVHLVFTLAALENGIAHLSIFRGWPDKLGADFARRCGTTKLFGDDPWPGGGLPFEAVDPASLEGTRASSEAPAAAASGTALFVLGSGTTGDPRIICYDAENIAAMTARDLAVRPIAFQERYYSMIQFDFFTGKRRALGCLAAGGTLVFTERAASAAIICERLAVDHFALVVNHAEAMAEAFAAGAPRLPRLKSLVIGGSPISEDLRARLREGVSPNLYIGYGTNEIGEACFAAPDMQKAHPGTVGKPAPGVDIKIAGPDGEALAPGETGEVLLRAEGLFSQYLGEPEATARAFDGDWYRPGDQGALTPDGALIFKGRSDDMMIFDGISIYPREIEQALESHAAVQHAAAFPLSSAKRWQIPAAAVTVSDPSLGADALRRYCFAQIGPKTPEHIWIVDEMPRNPAGKILKGELAKLAEKNALNNG